MAGLHLKAQGTHITSDDRLIFAVEVLDDEGKPVLGLKKSNFKIWQMGHLFGDLTVDIVVPLEEIDALKGSPYRSQKLVACGKRHIRLSRVCP